MKLLLAIKRINSRNPQHVFSKEDLRLLFPGDSERALTESLRRLDAADVLKRACYGVYVNETSPAFQPGTPVLERIALVLREEHINYLSLESMLIEYGLIRGHDLGAHITVMTSGRGGLINTCYGHIEFVHTNRDRATLLEGVSSVPHHSLPVASAGVALRDFKASQRKTMLTGTTLLEHPES